MWEPSCEILVSNVLLKPVSMHERSGLHLAMREPTTGVAPQLKWLTYFPHGCVGPSFLNRMSLTNLGKYIGVLVLKHSRGLKSQAYSACLGKHMQPLQPHDPATFIHVLCWPKLRQKGVKSTQSIAMARLQPSIRRHSPGKWMVGSCRLVGVSQRLAIQPNYCPKPPLALNHPEPPCHRSQSSITDTSPGPRPSRPRDPATSVSKRS